MRDITHIVLHHNGVPGRTIDDIRRTHLGFGWSDIGYHVVVHEDGTLHEGRPLWRPGAHMRGANRHTIGICYIGNGNDAPPNTRQWRALRNQVERWCDAFALPIERVVGHREWERVPGATRTHKTCPGRRFDLDQFRASLWLTPHNS